MWIDKQGRVHHRSPAAAAAARESASIVVRHGRRALEFGFYPDTVSARAVLQAVEIIRDSRPGTHITLAPLGDGRQKRAFNDQPAAITMMISKEFQVQMMFRIRVITIVVRIWVRVICQKRCSTLAPSTLAAS